MNVVLVGILAYILLQLLLGYVVSRRIRTEDDYLLAGRSLGYGLATFSIFATWFGAESCIGASGAVYSDGLSGTSADPFGYGLSLLLMGLFLAVPLWKMRLTTIADFYRKRFSGSVERLAAVIMIPTSLLWAGAQIRAFGQVLSTSSTMDVSLAVSIAASVVVAYTVMGGLLADAITDLVQGLFLVGGLLWLGVVITDDHGGFREVVGTITSVADSLNRTEEVGGIYEVLQLTEMWAIPVFGSLLAQEVISRVLASRSHIVARRSTLVAAGSYVLVGLIPVGLGLFGKAVMPELDYPEAVLPELARSYLPSFMFVLFAGALVSAILSTVDSTLLAASALFSRNVIPRASMRSTDAGTVKLDRFAVAGMGIIAYLLALTSDGVYDLVKDAASFGSSGIFVVFVFGMYSSIGGVKSGLWTLWTGVVVWVVGHYLLEFELSYLASLAVSLLVYLSFSLLENRQQGQTLLGR